MANEFVKKETDPKSYQERKKNWEEIKRLGPIAGKFPKIVSRGPCDKRGIDTDEMRYHERRGGWEELSSDPEYWKRERRRKYGSDRRKQSDKRIIGNRRRAIKDRRGNPLSKPPHDSRYLPEDLLEARAVSGGATKRQRSMSLGSSIVSAPKYVPPVSSKARGESKDLSSFPFENTFPGWKGTLRSVAISVRNLFRRKG